MTKSRRSDVTKEELSSAFPDILTSSESVSEISRLAGDVSTRTYDRVFVKTSSAPSFILQGAEPFEEGAKGEHLFLSSQRLLRSWGVSVPSVVASSPARGWVLQEDLGDEMLQNRPTAEFYRKTIDQLVRWIVASASESGSPTPHFRQFFDFEKLQAEMKFTATHLLEGLLKVSGDEYLRLVAPLCRTLAARPRFFCHRDYHSRNVMLFNENTFIIDFQDARLGPITYDIVSLVWDPYVRLSESFKLEMLEYWRTSLLKSGERKILEVLGDGAPDAGWRLEMHRMKVQRLMKASGSYAAFYLNRGRKDYLHCVAPCLNETRLSLAALVSLGHATVEEKELFDYLGSLNLSPVDILI